MVTEGILSIIRSGTELSPLKSSTSDGPERYTCPLCPTTKLTPGGRRKIEAHLQTYHIQHAVKYKEFLLLPCNLPCAASNHLHCPKCGDGIVKKAEVRPHITKCQGNTMGKTTDKSAELTNATTDVSVHQTEETHIDSRGKSPRVTQQNDEAPRVNKSQNTDIKNDKLGQADKNNKTTAEVRTAEQVKRKRGRPRKSSLPCDQAQPIKPSGDIPLNRNICHISSAADAVNSTTPIKRKRGRPRKSEALSKSDTLLNNELKSPDKNHSQESTNREDDDKVANDEDGLVDANTDEEESPSVSSPERTSTRPQRGAAKARTDQDADCLDDVLLSEDDVDTSDVPDQYVLEGRADCGIRQHVSFCKGDYNTATLKILPSGGCSLCETGTINRSRVNWIQHLKRVHYQDRIIYGGMAILRCQLSCGVPSSSTRGRPHWHCAHCAEVFLLKLGLIKHLRKHMGGSLPAFLDDSDNSVQTPKIFDQVAATINMDILKGFPESPKTFIHKLHLKTGVTFTIRDNGICLIKGTWSAMVEVQKELAHMLNSSYGEKKPTEILTAEYSSGEPRNSVIEDLPDKSPLVRQRLKRKHSRGPGRPAKVAKMNLEIHQDLVDDEPHEDELVPGITIESNMEAETLSEQQVSQTTVEHTADTPRDENPAESLQSQSSCDGEEGDKIVPDKEMNINADDVVQFKESECNIEAKSSCNVEEGVDDTGSDKESNVNMEEMVPVKEIECNAEEVKSVNEIETGMEAAVSATRSEFSAQEAASAILVAPVDETESPIVSSTEQTENEQEPNEKVVESNPRNIPEDPWEAFKAAVADVSSHVKVEECGVEEVDILVKTEQETSKESRPLRRKRREVNYKVLDGGEVDNSDDFSQEDKASSDDVDSENRPDKEAPAADIGYIKQESQEQIPVKRKRHIDFQKQTHVCKHCNKTFKRHCKLLYHQMYSKCKGLLDDNVDIIERILRDVAENVKSTTCPLCKKTFKRMEEVKMHYAGRVCQQMNSYHNPSGLRRDSEGMFMCFHCDFKASKAREVAAHEKEVHLEKKFPCEQCGKKFVTKSLLRSHIKWSHTAKEVYVQCKLCKESTTLNKMSKHMTEVHGNGKKPYKALDYDLICEICSYTTRHKAVFQRHMQRFHSDGSMYRCEVCNKTFRVKEDLRKHEIVHNDELRQKWTVSCPYCDKKLLKKNLQIHIRVVHEKRRDYSCSVCGKNFSTKHLKKLHEETHRPDSERTYKYFCQHCGLGFYHRLMCEDHQSKHTGSKSHHCEICGKVFRFHTSYVRHKELHGPATHECPQCPKVFTSNRLLQEHIQKHQSTKRYICPCGKVYMSAGGLNHHQNDCPAAIAFKQQQDNDAQQPVTIVMPGDAGLVQDEALQNVQIANLEDMVGDGHQVTIVLENPSDLPEYAVQMDADGQPSEQTVSVVESLFLQDTNESGEVQVVTENVAPEDVSATQAVTTELSEITEVQEQQERIPDNYLCGYCQVVLNSLQDVQSHMMEFHMQEVMVMDEGMLNETPAHEGQDGNSVAQESELVENTEARGPSEMASGAAVENPSELINNEEVQEELVDVKPGELGDNSEVEGVKVVTLTTEGKDQLPQEIIEQDSVMVIAGTQDQHSTLEITEFRDSSELREHLAAATVEVIENQEAVESKEHVAASLLASLHRADSISTQSEEQQ